MLDTPNTYVARTSSYVKKGSYVVKIGGTQTGVQLAKVQCTVIGEDENPASVSLDSNKK